MSLVGERFDGYVNRCLYHPETGFYAGGGGTAGRAGGDFITSPETGPLFADVVGRALDQWWVELGRPDPYRVFDAGTGPGTLARQLGAVDGPSAEARIVVGYDHADEVPTDLVGAVVIANELLDNLAFRVLERTSDGWSEWHVVSPGDGGDGDGDGDGDVALELVPVVGTDTDTRASGLIRRLEEGGDAFPVGTRVPLLEAAGRWVDETLAAGAARVVAFDYGLPTTAALARRGGWLRTYQQHRRGDDPLREPGAWDITTDIGFDQLPPTAELLTQSEFLHRWGIGQLVEEGRQYWKANAARPDLAAMRMRSRVSEAESLTDPAGLGGWLVAHWQR